MQTWSQAGYVCTLISLHRGKMPVISGGDRGQMHPNGWVFPLALPKKMVLWGGRRTHEALCPALSLPQELTESCVLEVVCTWGTGNENWAAAVHTCPAAGPAPETVAPWPAGPLATGCWRGATGRGELNGKPPRAASHSQELNFATKAWL